MRHDVDLSTLGPIATLAELDSTPPPVKFDFASLQQQPLINTHIPHQGVEERARHYWQMDLGGPS